MTYSGRTTAATLSQDSAPAVAGDIINDLGLSFSSGVIRNEGERPVRSILSVHRQLPPGAAWADFASGLRAKNSTRERVDETEACDTGDIRITGDVSSATGLGSITYSFRNCVISSVALSGAMSIRVDGYDMAWEIATNATYTYQNYRISVGGTAQTLHGTIHSTQDRGETAGTDTYNLVARWTPEDSYLRLENFVVDWADEASYPYTFSMDMKGRAYHSSHGYVDFASGSTLSYPNPGSSYATSGSVTLVGAGGARVVITAGPEGAILALDLDGDGNAELAVPFDWSELSAGASVNGVSVANTGP